MNAERLQLKQENWLLKAVRQERDELPIDYHAVRDRTLNKLKVGRQSPSGKAIDIFIKELGKAQL